MTIKTLPLIIFVGLCLNLGCAGEPGNGGDAGVEGKASGDDKAAAAPLGQGPADAGPRGDPKAGEAIYKSRCLACHQADGKGMNGAMGGNFVEEKFRLAKPDSELLKTIAEGVQGKKAIMPPQKDVLSEQERKDALAYIRETFGDK